jgi:hypothetical protein
MSALLKIAGAWSSQPDWLLALAEACDEATQAAAARRIGYSGATVSYVLNGRYTGDLKAVEAAVRDALMRGTVECPVLGEIVGEDCRKHQAAKFSAGNPQRIAVFRACRNGCRHSRLSADRGTP